MFGGVRLMNALLQLRIRLLCVCCRFSVGVFLPKCGAFFPVDLTQQAVQLCRIAGKQLRREPFICKMAEHRFKRSFRICAFLTCDHPLP